MRDTMTSNDRLAADLAAYEQRKAARAMLAALKNLMSLEHSGIVRGDGLHDITSQAQRAIAAAEAAGIKTEE